MQLKKITEDKRKRWQKAQEEEKKATNKIKNKKIEAILEVEEVSLSSMSQISS